MVITINSFKHCIREQYHTTKITFSSGCCSHKRTIHRMQTKDETFIFRSQQQLQMKSGIVNGMGMPGACVCVCVCVLVSISIKFIFRKPDHRMIRRIRARPSSRLSAWTSNSCFEKNNRFSFTIEFLGCAIIFGRRHLERDEVYCWVFLLSSEYILYLELLSEIWFFSLFPMQRRYSKKWTEIRAAQNAVCNVIGRIPYAI